MALAVELESVLYLFAFVVAFEPQPRFEMLAFPSASQDFVELIVSVCGPPTSSTSSPYASSCGLTGMMCPVFSRILPGVGYGPCWSRSSGPSRRNLVLISVVPGRPFASTTLMCVNLVGSARNALASPLQQISLSWPRIVMVVIRIFLGLFVRTVIDCTLTRPRKLSTRRACVPLWLTCLRRDS